MKIQKFLLSFMVILVFFAMSARMGFAQPFFGPWGLPWISPPFYSPVFPFGGSYFPFGNPFPPFYGGSQGWGMPFGPITAPSTTLLSPFRRAPNATIIFSSPTLTSLSSAPGVILVGATGVLGVPTVVAPTAITAPVLTPTLVAPPPVPTIANPVPAPLFSILAVLYASALLDGKALLSTANPLLFAYLSTLLL